MKQRGFLSLLQSAPHPQQGEFKENVLKQKNQRPFAISLQTSKTQKVFPDSPKVTAKGICKSFRQNGKALYFHLDYI